MKLEITDFNKADVLAATTSAAEWNDIAEVLSAMPLHLKASDQAGIQGSAIFDPVGTNEHIKTALVGRNWQANILTCPPKT